MLKIGVLGAGHLGKIHIRCIKEIADFQLIGFYDVDPGNTARVESEYGVKAFSSIGELIEAVDVVDIVTPTVSHFECATAAIEKGRHVFIEKPITSTIEEAAGLIELARQKGIKVQIGHVERFNPAFLAAKPFFGQPLFIETHRLAQFNPRGTDVPVVLDLMIHDIDIVLSVVKSEITHISASGVSIICDTPDIANARLEFANGCTVNLTASRISMKNMRKSRFFQRDAYIAVDFLEKSAEIIRMRDVPPEETPDPYAMLIDTGKNQERKQIFFDNPEIRPINAIKTELESFYASITGASEPVVSIHDGYKALDLAYKIMEKISEAQARVNL